MLERDSLQRTAINTNYEVRYWSEKFNVSPDQLRAAIKKVGHLASAVEKELRCSNIREERNHLRRSNRKTSARS